MEKTDRAADTQAKRAERASRLAEAFPLIAAAVLGVAGVVLFLAVLWPEAEGPTRRDRVDSPPDAAAVAESPAEAAATSSPAPAAPVAPEDHAAAQAIIPAEPQPRPAPEKPQTRRSEARGSPQVQAMVDSALAGDHSRVQQLARKLAAARPAGGERARARQLNAQGIALVNSGRYDEAVPTFEAAHEADRADPEVRENLGYALLRAGRIEQAEHALLSALETGPTRASAWGSLAFAYAKLGRHSDAVQLIRTAYRFAPDQKKTLETYTRQASTDPDPKVRAMLVDALAELRKTRPESR